jgi:molybdopterin converting factor small subunit
LKITLYGKLGEALGREIAIAETDVRSISQVRRVLADRHPDLASDFLSVRVRACVNDAIVGDEHAIEPGDTVALLPPVSGG